MAMELGESQAIPRDEKRRDDNISVSFSFENIPFSTFKMFSTYPLPPVWLSNDRVRFTEKSDPIKFPSDRIRDQFMFLGSSTHHHSLF